MTEIKECTYYIREVPNAENTDVIYDATLYKVVVEVGQKDNSLEVKSVEFYSGTDFDNCEKSESGVTFTNYLREDAKVTLKASKRLEGKDLTAGAYTFYLKNADGEIIQTKTNTANGDIVFDQLTYGDVGTYRHTNEEQIGTDPYKTYDSRIIHVTVKVSAGEDAYVADVAYTDATGSAIAAKFRNVFSDCGFASLDLLKVNESGLALNGVEFALTHNCGESCTATVDAIVGTSNTDGEVILDHIPSGHTYTLSETKVPAHYTKAEDVKVTVSFGKIYIDANEKTLDSALTIVNYCQGKAGIQGKKTL